MKCFNRKIRSFNFLYLIRFSIKWHLEQGHIIHRSPIFQPPSAGPRVGLAGLLIIFSTVLPLPYPSGSPLDFYLCMHNSTVHFLCWICYLPMLDKWPQELLICFLFLLLLCPFFSPPFYPAIFRSCVVFSSHRTLTFHNLSLIPAGKWTRFQERW